MIACDFLDPQKPKLLMQRIRRLFARARLEKEEVQILRGILTALGKRW
jgi:tRNA/rRNA methyltransferase